MVAAQRGSHARDVSKRDEIYVVCRLCRGVAWPGRVCMSKCALLLRRGCLRAVIARDAPVPRAATVFGKHRQGTAARLPRLKRQTETRGGGVAPPPPCFSTVTPDSCGTPLSSLLLYDALPFGPRGRGALWVRPRACPRAQ